jgi:hypothetical protein
MADELLSVAKLANMRWLGFTMEGREYVVNESNAVVAGSGPWRRGTNGNPGKMHEVAEALLEESGVKVLFVVERSVNRNIVVYTANVDSYGNLNAERPVNEFWLMVPPDAPISTGEEEEIDLGNVYTEDLTSFERSMAYGARVAPPSSGTTTVFVKALDSQPIQIRPPTSPESRWHATISVDGREQLILNRIMIYTESNLWGPWPRPVEMHVETQQALDSPSIIYHYAV